MDAVLQDVRYAVRWLRKSPAFAFVAVLTLALGIGANTAVFSIVYSVIFRPLPFPQPDRLMLVWRNTRQDKIREGATSFPNFRDWHDQTHSFERLAAFNTWNPVLTGRGNAERLSGLIVSWDFLRTLGVQPTLGRDFLVEEDAPNAGGVVLLTDALWRTRFGADAAIVGRTIALSGRSATIVGVLPRDFRSPLSDAQIFAPLAVSGPHAVERGNNFLNVLGRLRPGVTQAQAQRDIESVARRLEQQYPEENTNQSAHLVALTDQVTGKVRPALLVLLGSVGLVLLIACANVANLLLARASGRASEIAVRSALGATRARLVCQLITESVVIAGIGAAVGLFMAYWFVDGLVALAPPDVPRLDEVSINAVVLSFTIALTLVTAAAFGVLPAFHAAGTRLGRTLREANRGGIERRALRSVLVVTEIALALMLLVGASLLIRSFSHLTRVDTGFLAGNVLTGEIYTQARGSADIPRTFAFYEDVLTRVRALPGVASAGGVFGLPLSDSNIGIDFTIVGRPKPDPGHATTARVSIVTPGYFETLSIVVRAGRGITDEDRAGGRGVVVINESAARKFFPNADPVGQQINLQGSVTDKDDRTRTIIGVVANVYNTGPMGDIGPEMYVPMSQFTLGRMTLAVRTAGDPLALAGPIRAQIKAVNPDVPFANVHTMQSLVSDSVAVPRFVMLVLVAFALTALALALIGVYGVMAFSVARRTRELGLRIALGARAADVLKLIVAQGVRLALIGIAGGLGAAAAAARLMGGLLYGVGALDPVTYLTTASALLGIATLACYIPARRATRVDPMVALRSE